MNPSILVQVVILALAYSSSERLENKNLSGQIKNGNHQAFKTFFEEHHNALYRFLLSKGIEQEAAQDLIQKAFIYIWENRHKIDVTKSLRAYLFKIAYTRMLNYIRDRSKFAESDEAPLEDTGIHPDDYVQERQLHQAIRQAVENMPEKRKMVFEFCFIQEFTYKETARAMDISVKTVENHMGLAFKDIRNVLQVFDQKT